jgi:hypothetical protein
VDATKKVFNAPNFFPFCAADLPIPNNTSGIIYVLLSLQDKKTTYIGQTKHLSKRILQHNTMFGSKQTADPTLQPPWALLGIICGFENNRMKMLKIESVWEIARKELTRHRFSPSTIREIAKNGL